MHARELVELAAILSAQGPTLVRGSVHLSAEGVQRYWTASKCRLDRWSRNLRCFADAPDHLDARAAPAHWTFARGMLEEILTGEPLARVWSALLCLYDRQCGGDEFEQLARSIMAGHLESRRRVLTLMVRSPGIETAKAVKLNRLRRRAERWTDLLVGHLVSLGDVAEFAFDTDRAVEFARDFDYQYSRKSGPQVWPLLQASLRGAFERGMTEVSPNEDLNAEIGAAILSCFPTDAFDSTCLVRSLWLHRMSNVTNDVEGMIESLVGSGGR